jgi:hypothetical protein
VGSGELLAQDQPGQIRDTLFQKQDKNKTLSNWLMWQEILGSIPSTAKNNKK